MLSPTSELPPEIWCYIAQFAQLADRPCLALVNRSLYGIIASDLYRHVEVVGRDSTRFVYAFQMLNREQVLARRLRKLTIWVSALNEVIHSSDDATLATIPSTRRQEKDMEQRPQWLNKLRRLTLHHSRLENETPPPPLDKQRLFVDALTKAESLTDLVLVWRLEEGYSRASPTTCSQVVSLLWSNIGNTIRSLTLNFAMFNFFEALRSPLELKRLEELHIQIALEKHGAFRANATSILTGTLIPFINRLAPQLTAFSFTSRCNINLDPFFQEIAPTPLLRRLSLCLAFQVSQMWSAAALQMFLQNHNMIQHLSLRYADCCSGIYRHNWVFHNRVLIGEAFTDPNAVDFPQLESAELGLRFKLSADRLLGSYLSRFCGAVESLILLDCSLSFSQVREALVPFRDRLKFLTLFVDVLTPELLCLMARILPGLQSLTIRVQKITGSFEIVKRRDDENRYQDFLDEIQIRLSPSELEALTKWKLSELNILEFLYGKGEAPVRDIMRSITSVVPSITSWNA